MIMSNLSLRCISVPQKPRTCGSGPKGLGSGFEFIGVAIVRHRWMMGLNHTFIVKAGVAENRICSFPLAWLSLLYNLSIISADACHPHRVVLAVAYGAALSAQRWLASSRTHTHCNLWTPGFTTAAQVSVLILGLRRIPECQGAGSLERTPIIINGTARQTRDEEPNQQECIDDRCAASLIIPSRYLQGTSDVISEFLGRTGSSVDIGDHSAGISSRCTLSRTNIFYQQYAAISLPCLGFQQIDTHPCCEVNVVFLSKGVTLTVSLLLMSNNIICLRPILVSSGFCYRPTLPRLLHHTQRSADTDGGHFRSKC
ncbi:unnamed protein product [Somion occarium]|uniref:Uncharacterized protein n=1 Tax=Somion occarium TaxID=3059160 RepID=A0ABP1DWV7_9APHY